jgi:hypothetical protein
MSSALQGFSIRSMQLSQKESCLFTGFPDLKGTIYVDNGLSELQSPYVNPHRAASSSESKFI